MKAYEFERRQFVIGGIALLVVVIYIIRLAVLQLAPNDYEEISRNNAIYNRIIFPSRGSIYDRNGKLLVYNEPAYDVMVITREVSGLDTLDFCRTLHMSREEFDDRMAWIKDVSKNPGYSSYSQQLFRPQISSADFLVFQEKMFRFKGFYVRERNARQYRYPNAAHVLGYVAEVSGNDIAENDYYNAGDYIGKQGVERSYEEVLRGQKGIEVLLRDARGKIQGRYNDGLDDQHPIPGKDIVLSLDIELQALGERLMRGKRGAIVAIEPSTGEMPPKGPLSLELRDVSFAYPESDFCLKHLSLKIEPGEKIGIVGENGAGKSTMAKLLLRLYDVDSGAILYNGKPIGEWDVHGLRRRVGIAFQDANLYALTLRENLQYYNPEASDERRRKALKTVGLERLDDLEKTVSREFLEDGIMLSGGETQRLALARLLMDDFGLMILDEPSSALDPLAEYKMTKLMFDVSNTTTIMIAHRLSTIRDADRIYLISDGEVAEQGTHNELMALNGKYAEMFRKQAENYVA